MGKRKSKERREDIQRGGEKILSRKKKEGKEVDGSRGVCKQGKEREITRERMKEKRR